MTGRYLSRRGFIAAATKTAAATAAGLAGTLLPAAATAGPARPLVFAHRGASALRPEHTLAAYAKAIADGADFIEPDLVSTKDGVLVARHEAFLAETTDVAKRPEFASRRVRRTIDGDTHEGWFVDDFTLAELKTLRAIERIPVSRPESASYDGMFQVVTFEEVIDFVAAQSATIGRVIGLVPELKHSTYFARAGLPLEERFMATLAAHEYTRRAPVEIQSFEVANLRLLREKLDKRTNLRLMQLVGIGPVKPSDVAAAGGSLTYAEMATPAGLREIARYADVFSPPTRALIPLAKDGRLAAPTSLASDARAAGLRLETWTFRPENRFIAADFRDGGGEHARNEAGSIAEMRRYLELGLDGFFTDDPALGVKAVAG
ncbi:glycerophosphodiester phosphodiesterase [Pseudoduganella albidiflava]|uniref:glycerophosphodiester phosphodiesterase n=1 Tax=Pseudoduganella albidiflava TaxID=321983 RepID=A0A411WU33_9BURK|nr:glycerophosphodiester phosphodiesterase [Pseudoduganella albidiflava]QBI00291.1 glycerophosphodiester phosphodiesterase [Pseudoduganella albidiflava]GGY52696.1 glycerophosphoryl diester phosphodiesterase [Pseudoduganella albidiflava]